MNYQHVNLLLQLISCRLKDEVSGGDREWRMKGYVLILFWLDFSVRCWVWWDGTNYFTLYSCNLFLSFFWLLTSSQAENGADSENICVSPLDQQTAALCFFTWISRSWVKDKC